MISLLFGEHEVDTMKGSRVMTTTAFTRTLDGQEVPATGTYAIDPAHTRVGFQVQHMGISKVRGNFTEAAGTITVGETPAGSSVAVTIQAASIDTAQGQRDEHLRSGDFLDTSNHPTLDFHSTGIEQDDDE